MHELGSFLRISTLRMTSRGNAAIRLALRLMRGAGKSVLYLQNQGGWMTYAPFGKREGFTVKRLPTEDGVLDGEGLAGAKDGVLLLNSLPGYHRLQDMGLVMGHARESDLLVINDITGSLPYPEARKGHLLVGSLNHGKPLAVGKGGFAASADPAFAALLDKEPDEPHDAGDLLAESVRTLPQRLEKVMGIKRALLEDLRTLVPATDLLTDSHGYNIIIPFHDRLLREKLIGYCTTKSIPWTECPREIRIMRPAISLEIKRFF